jgi:hypothetical protein
MLGRSGVVPAAQRFGLVSAIGGHEKIVSKASAG